MLALEVVLGNVVAMISNCLLQVSLLNFFKHNLEVVLVSVLLMSMAVLKKS